MPAVEEFIEALVMRFPAFRPWYEQHLRDLGELLPHVVFGVGEGLTDQIVDAYRRGEDAALDWRGVLEFVEAHFDRGDRGIAGLLVPVTASEIPRRPRAPGGRAAQPTGLTRIPLSPPG